jgi:branched-chain amino acid transport system permease protein
MLGYTMVHGIVKLTNFAPVTSCGRRFISYYAVSRFKLHVWLAALFPNAPPALVLVVGTITVMILSMVVCAVLAVSIERIAYKPLRNAPRISALITAIGVSFFLEYFGALPFVFTANYISYERPFEVVTWYIKDGILEEASSPPAILFSNILIIIIVINDFDGCCTIVNAPKSGKPCVRYLLTNQPLA